MLLFVSGKIVPVGEPHPCGLHPDSVCRYFFYFLFLDLYSIELLAIHFLFIILVVHWHQFAFVVGLACLADSTIRLQHNIGANEWQIIPVAQKESAYKQLTVSMSRPVYLAISSAGMPSAFMRMALSRLFSSIPSARPSARPLATAVRKAPSRSW